MLHLPQTITTPLTLSVSATTGDADVLAELRYDPNDPYAVTLAIGTECPDPVVWVFGRELLAAGVAAPAGEGDITIEPVDDSAARQLRITLATDCLATMTTSRDAVVEFLVQSFAIVASGTEADHIDWDAEISSLIG